MTNGSIHTHRPDCRLCASSRIQTAVPLAAVPLSTPNAGEGRRDVLVPLDLYRCEDCGHLQLLDVVDPGILYSKYRYRTSISRGLPEHFGRMAADLAREPGLAPGSLVVEIGSNDGTLLKAFQQLGFRTLGIDPAREIAAQATARGQETWAEFFDPSIAEQILARHGQANLVVANNVVANIDALIPFISGVRAILAPGGRFVFETQNGADVIAGNLIDTVYHEHLSYFLVRPLVRFFANAGLALTNVEAIATKGGSFRLTVRHAGTAPMASVAVAIALEEAAGLYHSATYRTYVERLAETRRRIGLLLEDFKGKRVVGYGASVGSVTLLHQFELTHRLEFLVDDNAIAPDLSGPDYSLPILPSTALDELKVDLAVILAWRYAEPIISRNISWKNKGGQFLIPLPDPHIQSTWPFSQTPG